jgi:pantoate--beta-alanine ligase
MQKYSFFGKVSTYNHSFDWLNWRIMLVFEKADLLHKHILKLKEGGKSVGFVATMGALHSGHLRMVKRSKQENDITITSIFVNPTQFNNPEDLKKYPRDTDRDLNGLEEYGCDITFLPSVDEIYPDKVESDDLDLEGLDVLMEGEFRPGHFKGVVTVIKRFFDILIPTKAYFGEKDFQQYLIIKRMTILLKLGVEIVGHPIERSEKGLALSSRNERLDESQKTDALIIISALKWAQQNHHHLTPLQIKTSITEQFDSSTLDLEYVEICNAENLQAIESWAAVQEARIFISAYSGKVRLIDNESLF